MTNKDRVNKLVDELHLPVALEIQSEKVSYAFLRKAGNTKAKDLAKHIRAGGNGVFVQCVARFTYTKGGAFYSVRVDLGEEQPGDITEGEEMNALLWSIRLDNLHPDEQAHFLEAQELTRQIRSAWIKRQAKRKMPNLLEALDELEDEELEALKKATCPAEAFRKGTDYTHGTQVESHAVRIALEVRAKESNHQKLKRLKRKTEAGV